MLKYLREKWTKLIDKEKKEGHNEEYRHSNIEIVASRIDKSKSKSLGITLEGTVDIDDQGNETYPHHYIRSVMQNGPVDTSLDVKFCSGDELLEIDFVKLYAINYMELLDILKALKSKIIYMVCARKLPLNPAESISMNGGVCMMNKRAKSEGFLNGTTTPDDANLKQEVVGHIEQVYFWNCCSRNLYIIIWVSCRFIREIQFFLISFVSVRQSKHPVCVCVCVQKIKMLIFNDLKTN